MSNAEPIATQEPDLSVLDFTQEQLSHLLGAGEGLDKKQFKRVYMDADHEMTHNTVLKFLGLCPEGHRDITGVMRPGASSQDNFDAAILYVSDPALALLHEIQTRAGQVSFCYKDHLGNDIAQHRGHPLFPWDKEDLADPKKNLQKRGRKSK